jgi:hypothetical protein
MTMRISGVVSVLLVGGAVLAIACSKNPPPPQAPAGTTTTTSVEVGGASSRLAHAHCKHAQACGEIGGSRTYPTMEACMEKNRSDAESDLRASECPRGVDSSRLQACLSAVDSEACSGIGSGWSRSLACKTSALCP